jgi:hypothetical protein
MRTSLIRFTLTVLLLSLTHLASAQVSAEEEGPAKPGSPGAPQVYVELGGPGIIYSFNYDRRFNKSDKGLGMRAGFGAIFAGGEGGFAFPIGLNYLTGRQGNYFEVGGGASVVTTADLFEGAGVYGFMTAGYRRQAFKKKGVTWRVAFNPLLFFEEGFSFIPFFGASVGYRF